MNHQITTIVAPAGYGKTVWVSSLLAQPDWPATAWYSLEQQNIEPYNFFYGLIQAVKKVFPGFGLDSLRTLKSLENLARDWSIAAKTFLDELPRDRQLILVFDDLHLVYKNEPVVALLNYLLQRLPENHQVVLIARFKPSFKLYPKELAGELLQIKRQELLFTPEEALDLFTFMGLELAGYLALEPVDESLIRLSMKILSQQGKKQKAISLYRSLVTTLKEDYDTAPEPDTSALFYSIFNSRSEPGKEASHWN